VIEAVPEIMEIKARIFHVLSIETKEDCILATNTSSLSISDIASASSKPDKVIGMHFFNPVPIMKLLEIVKHDLVSEETISFAQEVADAMGKTSILVNDVPGFATSRLGVVLGNESIRMLADGVASASDIDTAMRLGYKHPMGPLELSDLVGLDVRRDILNNLAEAFADESYRPHPMLDKLVEAGDLGKKSGKGIYDWSSGQKEERTL
jgi:3-hydroxybutyryl-CoA dehydrogenase